MRLLSSQRRDILAAIRDAGYDRAQFEVVDARDEVGMEEARVNFIGTSYRLTMAASRGEHDEPTIWIWYAPGPLLQNDQETVSSWTTCMQVFVRWLGLLQRELEAEAELLPNPAELPPVESDAAAELSEDDRRGVDGDLLTFANEVGKRFDSLKVEVQAAGYDAKEAARRVAVLEAQNAQVLRELEYLREASGRVGKKDWSLLAIGSLVTMSVGAALPPEMTRQFLLSLLQKLGTVRLLAP